MPGRGAILPDRRGGHIKSLKLAIRLLVGAFAAWCIVAATIDLGSNYDNRPRLDAAYACDQDRSARCYWTEDGTVTGYNGFWDRLHVTHENGERTSVELTDDAHPPIGASVRVEHWGGDEVGVMDLTDERRYDSVSKPEPWDPADFVLLVVGLAIVPFALGPRGRRAVWSILKSFKLE